MTQPRLLVVAAALSAAVTACAAVTSTPADSHSPAARTPAASPSAAPSTPADSPSAVTITPGESGSATCEPAEEGAVESTQIVSGTANIFGAGRDSPPSPGDGGGGTLPPLWELPSGSTVVTIPSASGEVTPYTAQPLFNGAAGDRRGAGGDDTDVTSYEGISGIVNRGNGMFLVGVFLTDAAPADPAPPRIDFTDDETFAKLAPEIGQTFLIGDGKDRTYCIPSGATRLFIGFADAYGYEGAPGWYGNNGGELRVTVAVAGE